MLTVILEAGAMALAVQLRTMGPMTSVKPVLRTNDGWLLALQLI